MSTQGHQCCATCHVTLEFGNVYRCHSSQCLHVCDANCDQRVRYDRYSTICRVSRRVFPPFTADLDAPAPMRKRTNIMDDERECKRPVYSAA